MSILIEFWKYQSDIFILLAITFGALVVTLIGLIITLLVRLWKGDF